MDAAAGPVSGSITDVFPGLDADSASLSGVVSSAAPGSTVHAASWLAPDVAAAIEPGSVGEFGALPALTGRSAENLTLDLAAERTFSRRRCAIIHSPKLYKRAEGYHKTT